MSLEVFPIPALSDNYAYALFETDSHQVAVVDPSTFHDVDNFLNQRGWGLHLILNTHHHPDHTGGNEKLKSKYDCPIVGAEADQHRIHGLDQKVNEGDSVSFSGDTAEVLSIPGHTSGHIAFWFQEANALFCGDTLFSLGCGRVFEGTYAEMWESLKKLRDLPSETKVYCGHEYTQKNVEFSLSLTPNDKNLLEKQGKIYETRQQGLPTVPSTLEEEKKLNPFLRCDDKAFVENLQLTELEPDQVFAEIRQKKDRF